MMKIGELARVTEVSIETIRFYERVDLLPPAQRTAGNYRVYDKAHAERLRLIRNCRALDMTLDEVRSLLAMRDDPKRGCLEANEMLDEQIEHVAGRIVELQGLERALRELRRQCSESHAGAECGIFTGLAGVSPSGEVARTRKPWISR
jgi:Cd(II)/Pb(II)-responsive transcriptional regulator